MEHNFMIIAEKQQLAGPMALFNRCRAEGEILYNAFETLDAFNAFFLNRQDGVKTVCISDEEDGCFGCGCLNEEKTKGYITFIGVRKDLRRRGLGRELLHTLEA